jgi:hypothetical protein
MSFSSAAFSTFFHFIAKTSLPNEEIDCIKPSLSGSVPWYGARLGLGKVRLFGLV